jgi:hypothetical protein
MKVLGMGHAAVRIEAGLIVFDADLYRARGGDPQEALYSADHGIVEVPDFIGQFLIDQRLGLLIPEEPKARGEMPPTQEREAPTPVITAAAPPDHQTPSVAARAAEPPPAKARTAKPASKPKAPRQAKAAPKRTGAKK